jgi:FkbH-like protein
VAQGSVAADFHVGLAASFTAEPLVPFLTDALLEAGLRPEVTVAPYGQLFQVCLDPGSAFGAPLPDAIVLLWRIEEMMAAPLEAFLAGDRSALARARQGVAELVDAVTRLRERFPGIVILGTPPFPDTPGAHLLAPDNPGAAGRFHLEVLRDFCDLARRAGVVILDLDALQRHHGASRALDLRKWYLYHQPYRDDFLHLVGSQLGGLIALRGRAARKCVVVDCDNTLWGGVVGEDGPQGLQLGHDFPGSAYRDFQRLLLHWRSRGVLLAISSKNNAEDVWEVFDGHSGMVLRREHLAASRIDWEPKSTHLAAIARELNIATDSLVFIDDDPREIAEVQAALPEVAALHVPAEPARLVEHMRACTLFDALDMTEEDRRRSEMMTEERERVAVQGQLSADQFLATLGLRVEVFAVEQSHVARVAQLINKTNQFNLTTVRRTPEQVAALVRSPDHRVFAAAVADRFGDYGLTGVVVARCGATEWELDTLLLSCRVLGRQVESAVLAAVGRAAHVAGAGWLRARFIETAKNAPAADFLPRHRFVQEKDGSWLLSLVAPPEAPSHVTLEAREGARATATRP